jgi:hypothetical protein
MLPEVTPLLAMSRFDLGYAQRFLDKIREGGLGGGDMAVFDYNSRT